MRSLLALTCMVAAFALTGCTGDIYPADGGDIDIQVAEQFAAPTPESPLESYEDTVDAGPSQGGWSCYWAPTMNDNWHDDVLCANGMNFDRPTLLPDWGYVTYEDMMAEAYNYEQYLNNL